MTDTYELNLLKQAKEGNRESENEFIKNNIGLVHLVVKRFLLRGSETEDLVQIGMLGLYKAMKNFDFSYDVKFSTYAVPMITGEIKRYLRDDGIIKVSRTIKEMNKKIKFETEKFEKENQRQPSLNEISQITGISKEDIIAQGIVSREDYEQLEAYTRAVFQRGTEIAAKMGLILVDTKYEFGKKEGKIYLMDEIHTPDSSRYFYAEGYAERLAAGEKQKQLSKEFVREWLMANGFQGQDGQKVPEMTEDIVNGITDRYIELYENITGEKFEKAEGTDILARIEKNVSDCLARL